MCMSGCIRVTSGIFETEADPMTADQVAQLARAIGERHDQLVIFAAYTGLRAGGRWPCLRSWSRC